MGLKKNVNLSQSQTLPNLCLTLSFLAVSPPRFPFPSFPKSLALSNLIIQSISWLLSSMAIHTELTDGRDGGGGEGIVHIL